MNDDRLHPVTRENLHQRRPEGRCWKMTASDRYGHHPSLIGYTTEEPRLRRLAQFQRHYATLIYAMPSEVRTRVEFLPGEGA